ncbi:MAG: hypothetical protein OEY92_00220 [Elusimicrobiota bacterium]|nr:hypothetical protein [Elusimicrobiota bacterium]
MYGIKKFGIICGIVLLCGVKFSNNLHAGGIAVKFASIVLEDLEPGGVYNLRAMRGLSYTVMSKYERTRDIEIAVEKPNIGECEKGYEPLPDTTWVRIIPNNFRLGYHENAHCAIIISIPEKEEYRGRHFQVSIIARAKTDPFTKGVALVAQVKYKLRFSVGTEAPKTLEMARKREKFMMLNFRLEPDSLYLHNIEPGKQIILGKKEIPALKVINLGPEKLKLEFNSVPCNKGFGISEGYQPAPDPRFLNCTKETVSVKPDHIVNIPVVLEIPDEPEYRGKKYAFIIKAELKDVEVPLEIYSRIYVETEK